MSYRGTIGLEIHAHLKTSSKLFCTCSTEWTDESNTYVCEVCLGYPGSMPRLNRNAVIQAIRVVQSLGMEIADQVRFDRKHYVYPDLSKNYQTSQYYSTIGRNGIMHIEIRSKLLKIRIREAHLEEDAARLHHIGEESKVDFNRGGQPLLELVTEPDFHIGEEAETFIRNYQLLLRTIDASEANMEQGQLRCDANVSVSKHTIELGTRVEIKNISSPRFIRLAVDYEIQRQIEILEAGGQVTRETRRWNENRGRTEPIRTKEMALDYRYLPEPDLQVICLKSEELKDLKKSLPELPDARLHRFMDKYELSHHLARKLVQEPELADYFENCISLISDAELAAQWIVNQLRVLNNDRGLTFSDSPLTPQRLSELLQLVKNEQISISNAKKALDLMLEDERLPSKIIEDKNLGQISDLNQIQAWIDSVIKNNPDVIEKFEQGKTRVFQFLLGEVYKVSKGKVNPRLAKELFKKSLPVKQLCVLGMGGAITAVRDEYGTLTAGDDSVLSGLISTISNSREDIIFESMMISRELSENISAQEWFALYERLKSIIYDEDYIGVLVSHGLDTLPYTASLMRWLLPGPAIPVIFTGAIKSGADKSSDALDNLSNSVDSISSGIDKGFWLKIGKRTLPATNFHMTGIHRESMDSKNISKEQFAKLASGHWEKPEFNLNQLEAAVARSMIVKVYPGLNPDWIASVVDSGVRYIILELFDTGTAYTKWGSAESLLPLLHKIKSKEGIVFCTSQLGIPVTMSDYDSSRDLWDAGIVPLGSLLTETAYTKLIVAQLLENQSEEIIDRMIGEEFSL
jgi:aspartyl-tRNA(Asn)/glutamyl-tRNA(Gln) amidotransferase subunit B